MRVSRFIMLLAFSALLALASCRKDDDVPSIDTTPVDRAMLRGGWGMSGSSLSWELSTFGKVLNNTYNFKKMIADKIEEDATDVSLYFVNDSIVYYVRHRPDDIPPYYYHTTYTMNSDTAGYIISFADSTFLGFYAPKVYVKRNWNSENGLILYLQRSEVIDMLDTEGELSSYMGIIRRNVEDAEVDLYIEHDDLDFYKEIQRRYK